MDGISFNLRSKISQRNTWISCLALLFVFIGYASAIVCISASPVLINAVGVILLVQSLIWAAYFVHDLVHGTLFRQPKVNAFVGNCMLFLTGSCYWRFQDLARDHLAHHKGRADFSAFSISDFLTSLPLPLRQLIIVLEWLYFPIVNFILRWFCIISPFLEESRCRERWRTIALLLIRGSLLIALGWYSLRAIALYGFAYICFINLLRFMDCFQHTYAVFQLGQVLPQYSSDYEEANTYSNLVSYRWKWLNLLFLNFGYHNAHHRVIQCPWYLLPQLDAELYPVGNRQHIPLGQLVSNYHKFRIARLFTGQGTVGEREHGLAIDEFVGGVGVSFLILQEPLSWLKLPSSLVQQS